MTKSINETETRFKFRRNIKPKSAERGLTSIKLEVIDIFIKNEYFLMVMKKAIIVGLVIVLFLISGCNTGIKTGKSSSPVEIELSLPQSKMNELSELNVKIEYKINETIPVYITLKMPDTIESAYDKIGFDNKTERDIVWSGKLSYREIKEFNFNIKIVGEGEYKQIVGCLISEEEGYAADCDILYITSKDNKIDVLTEEDMGRIVAQRADRTPLDQIQHRENMSESAGPVDY